MEAAPRDPLDLPVRSEETVIRGIGLAARGFAAAFGDPERAIRRDVAQSRAGKIKVAYGLGIPQRLWSVLLPQAARGREGCFRVHGAGRIRRTLRHARCPRAEAEGDRGGVAT